MTEIDYKLVYEDENGDLKMFVEEKKGTAQKSSLDKKVVSKKDKKRDQIRFIKEREL